MNLRKEVSLSQARVSANAGQILSEQGRHLIDIQYRLKPLTVTITGKLPDDLDQATLEYELKSFISSATKLSDGTWPTIQVSGYQVLVQSASTVSIMEQVIPVRTNLLESLLSNTYFIYTAFSPNCSQFKIKEIFRGFQEDDRLELESKIEDIIASNPGKPMLFYMNRISRIKRLSSGKYVRNLAGVKISSTTHSFFEEEYRKDTQPKILQIIDNYLEHGQITRVKSWNFDDNVIEDQPVVRGFKTLSTHILKVFIRDSKGVISTTANHPFYVSGKGWIKAIDMQPGDILVGKETRSTVAGHRLQRLPKPIYLYNLEVKKYNNYFVQANANSPSILVHNCNENDYDLDEYVSPPQDLNPDHKDYSGIFEHVCFTGDTQIRIKHGAKSIRLVEIGDEVLSCNDKTNTCEYKPVKKKYLSYTKRLVHVKAEGMTHAIRSTPNHPYFVAEMNDYVAAEDLKAGQHLVYQDPVTKENRLDVIESIEKEPLNHEIPVYNFGVELNENYYVAAATEFGENHLFKRFYKVHNCSAGLDFVPVVGGAKGLGEALVGKDLITQEDLAWWQRCIAVGTIVPGAGPALKRLANGIKVVSKDQKVLKHFANMEKAVEAEAKFSRVKNVNGRKPINSQYAGDVYPLDKLPVKNKLGEQVRGSYPHSVPFDGNGFPDFARYAEKKFKMEFTGSRNKDFKIADKKAGITKAYREEHGLTWHHHQDGETMLLIPTKIHDAVRHTGGVATKK